MKEKTYDEYLKMAYEAINTKQTIYKKLFEYYDGVQPLVYSTERLREAFDRVTARFTQNWLSVVVDSVTDRLVLKGFNHEDKEVNNLLDTIWREQGLNLDASDLHEAAAIVGEAFIIIDKDLEGKTEVYYNDPRMCHVFYDPNHPKKKLFGAKWYADLNNNYMILFLPSATVYYETGSGGAVSGVNAFVQKMVKKNIGGDLPIKIFQFKIKSQIEGILTLQDAVNKLFADMMVTGEYGAFPQRWVISNADIGLLKNSPNVIWDIPAADGEGQATQVGQFTPADLNNYFVSIDKVAGSMAIISRTPKHYFYSTGSNISGEALIAMESPLVKKVQAIQERLSSSWQDVAEYICYLNGKTVEKTAIEVVWGGIEGLQPLTQSQTIKTSVESGIPLFTQLRRSGWANDEIDQLIKDREDEQKRAADLKKLLMDEAQIRSSSQNPGEEIDSDLENA